METLSMVTCFTGKQTTPPTRFLSPTATSLPHFQKSKLPIPLPPTRIRAGHFSHPSFFHIVILVFQCNSEELCNAYLESKSGLIFRNFGLVILIFYQFCPIKWLFGWFNWTETMMGGVWTFWPLRCNLTLKFNTVLIRNWTLHS